MTIDGQLPHILLVNTSPEMLALKREIFEEEEFRVTTRILSSTDVEEIARLAPDLIIVDYTAESQSALFRQLKSDPRTEPAPLVLCT